MFSNHVIKESKYCFKLIETKFNEPLVIAKKDQEDFKDSSKSCILKKHMKKVKG